jgi:hypothetical protein
MPREARLLVAIAALLASSSAADAPAASAADGPTLDFVGACPDEAAVRRLLADLLSPDEARDASVTVQDRGDRFRVAVGSAATMLEDPARDCAARARQAAVVAATTLQAQRIALGPPTWTVEKGLVIDVSGVANDPLWAIGAEIRGAYGHRRWSMVGAAGARGPVTLNFEDGWKTELIRFPVDVGARLTSYHGRWRPWLVLGGSATLNAFIGQDLVETQREWRLEPGGLVMGGLTLVARGRLGVAAALAVRWQPLPYRLHVTPIGQIGETPKWWFGLSLNYTIDGKPSTPP